MAVRERRGGRTRRRLNAVGVSDPFETRRKDTRLNTLDLPLFFPVRAWLLVSFLSPTLRFSISAFLFRSNDEAASCANMAELRRPPVTSDIVACYKLSTSRF